MLQCTILAGCTTRCTEKKLGLGRLHKKRLKKEDVSTRAFSKTENILRSSVLAREDNDSKNNWNVRKYYF